MSSLYLNMTTLQTEIAALRQRLAHLEDTQSTLQQTEAVLITCEARYTQIFNENSAIILVVDAAQRRIADANITACQFYGYSHAELTALTITQLNAFNTDKTELRQHTMLPQQSDRIELRHRLRSGEVRAVEAYITPIATSDQPLLFYIIHDTTALKEAEAQSRYQRDYLTALHETTLAMMQHIEPAILLQTILWQATTLMGSKHGAIYQLSDDGSAMIQTVTRGVAKSQRGLRIGKDEGALGQAWTTGQTVVIDDYMQWNARLGLDITAFNPLHSMVVTPLHTAGQVSGLIVVAHLTARQHFTPQQVSILNQFAHLASLALEKANFYTAAQEELEERRRVEAALRQVNERFELVEQVVNGGIYDWDLRNLTTAITPGFTRAFGYESHEIGDNDRWWEQRVHPDDWSTLKHTINHALEHHDALLSTYRFLTRAGTYRYVEDTAHIVRDSNGTAIRMVGSMVDITEQYEAEIALQESEERYRRLVEASPIPILVYQDHIIVYVNKAALELAQAADSAEMIGKSLFKYVHPDSLGLLNTPYTYLEQRTAKFSEARFFRLDGEVIDVEFSTIAIRFKGEPAIQIVARDITERKRGEQALRESEVRYRRLVDMAPMPIIVERGGTILYANMQALILTQVLPGDSLVGRSWIDFVHPDYHQGLRDRQAQPYAERSHVGEGRFVRSDGTLLDAEFSATIIMYEGQPATQVVVNDITARKQAEEQRILLERRLLETQKLESLGVLAGGIAHDFNNLLVSMLGNANLALLEVPADSPAREIIQHIEQAAQRAAELTNQMLAYAGRSLFIRKTLNVNALLEEIMPLLPMTLTAQTHLEYAATPNLPPIQGDAIQLREVVMNLVMNAVDAIGAQPGVLKLRAGLIDADKHLFSRGYLATDLPPGRYVFIEVADAGTGMNPETVAKMFDPFFTTKFTGRGLGLAAALGIVRGHNGSILVESAVEQGTKVMVLLPYAEQPAPSTAPAPTHPTPSRNNLVLVIDDEPEVRLVTQRILKRIGYATILAHDGYTGINLFREHAKDVIGVLLDLTMPEFDGKATFQALRQIDPNVRVILMSGYNEQYISHRFENEGLAGFLAKPFMIEDLRAKLAAFQP